MRRPLEFFSEPLPGVAVGSLRGKLIAFEGPAAVGCSTQVALLRDWLEQEGFATHVVSLATSEYPTVSDGSRALQELAAFALVLENTILPALREGAWVLADGYVFSWIARMQARGVAGEWLRQLAAFALVPHVAFCLRGKPEDLAARAAGRGGFGYGESAVDLRLGGDLCESFLRYQERVMASLAALSDEHRLIAIDASGSPDQVFRRVLREVRKL